jgi:serine protease Do
MAGTSVAQTPNSAAQLSDSFAEVAKKVEPAVVSIDTKGKTPEATTRGGTTSPSNPDDILEFFRRQSRRPTYSVGSGFIVDRGGFILTNEHVVKDAAKITVRLDDGTEYTARVIGSDEMTDIAVLKIEAAGDLPVVQMGDSGAARVGEWVLAIGSPFGLARTVTAGIVSHVNRDTPSTTPFQRFIQTDAAINRGNSGGPLVNMKGEVIGVNSQIATSTGDYNGVGFALPSNEAVNVYKQIVANGKVRRGFLGVALESVKPEFAKVFGLKDSKGAIVTEVRDPASAAALAGIKDGDIITDVNGSPVENANDLIAKIASTPPGQSISLGLFREVGNSLERRTIPVTLNERPMVEREREDDSATKTKLSVDGKKEESKPFGLTLGDLTPTLAATYKLEGQKGVIIKEVSPESFIADVRAQNGTQTALGPGDLIQRINRVSVTDTKAFEAAVKKLSKGDPVVLHVLTYSTSQAKPVMKVVQFTVQ